MFQNRYTVRDTPDYLVEIDDFDLHGQHLLFIHLGFKRFTKAVLTQVLKEWPLLREAIPQPLFCYAQAEDQKWKAFVGLLGFKPTDVHITLNNGEQRQVYLHARQ